MKSDDDVNIDRLGTWIAEQGLVDEETIDLLIAALDGDDNICLVLENIRNAGFGLEQFLVNESLELYFDIVEKGKSVGYISKGWDDPGFRVGEFFEMPKDDPAFKEKFLKVFQSCSTNLVSVSVTEKTSGAVGISLEIGIYKDGFNDKVLKEAVGSLEETMDKIRQTLDGTFACN